VKRTGRRFATVHVIFPAPRPPSYRLSQQGNLIQEVLHRAHATILIPKKSPGGAKPVGSSEKKNGPQLTICFFQRGTGQQIN